MREVLKPMYYLIYAVVPISNIRSKFRMFLELAATDLKNSTRNSVRNSNVVKVHESLMNCSK